MGEAPLLSLRGLRVGFGGVAVLRGLDLDVAAGEALGMVGESGCGKSVTWLAALRLLGRSARVVGEARLDGEDMLRAAPATLDRIRGGRVAMIFQDPAASLDPVRRVGHPVLQALALHRGLRGASARAEAVRLFEQVGLPSPARRLDAYPHELSGGQNQRVAIAAALAGRPALLVADEPTTALDATVQAQILSLLDALRRETGMALVLISHDLGVVSAVCDRVVVMYAGRLVEAARSDELFASPAHPYTAGLLRAVPTRDAPRLVAIDGQVPDPRAMPPGCAFAPRCVRATGACDAAPPEPRLVGGRWVACVDPEPALRTAA